MDVIKQLLGLVVRTFYSDRHVIVMDLLLQNSPYAAIFINHCSLSEEALATGLKERIKELNKVCGRLRLDGLLKMYCLCTRK